MVNGSTIAHAVWAQGSTKVSELQCIMTTAYEQQSMFPSGRKAPLDYLSGRRAPHMEAHLQITPGEQSSTVCGHNTTRTMQ